MMAHSPAHRFPPPPDLPDGPDTAPASPQPAPVPPAAVPLPSNGPDILGYVIKLQQRLDNMGNDGIAEYVAQNPGFVGELAEALRTTRSLGVLRVLNLLDGLGLVVQLF